ncbi:MAG: hypothetical protein MI919_02115, partial [Holophagales bacterium]|nr:hypothetical protein [Holophagales bacterium]
MISFSSRLRCRPSLFRPLGVPLLAAGLVSTLVLAPTAGADISGTVVDGGGSPVAGAEVRIQAMPEGPLVVTGADGTFTLPVAAPGIVAVAVAVPYDPDAAVNYLTQVDSIPDGSVGVSIALVELPTVANGSYDPPGVSISCATCHSEIVSEWQGSVHSTAAEDFWVRDLYSGDGSPGGSAGYVFLDTHDPGDTGACATCHAPMADAFDPGNVFLNDAFDSGDPAALD